MTLHSVALNGFRSYDAASFSFSEGVNVISGPNGTGKTNLLESVFYLSCCKGLRGAKGSEMIYFDAGQGQIDAV